jgi:subtilisin family serine protease
MRFIIGFLAFPLAFAAPVFEPRDGEDVVPDKWIVVMKSGISTSQLESTISSAQQQPGARQAHEVWDFDGFKGFSITGSRDAINTIADDNTIELIEPDSIVTTQSLVTQPDSTWGLSRISHRNPFQLGYPYDSTAGKGMVAYGIDTGIYIKHHEFQGRAVFGHSFVPGQKGDGHGHGTHTAGTIGGVTYGVAKNITLVAVKVLDNSGSGPNSQVISGIEWAVKDMKKRKAVGKAVANLSLAGPRAAVVNRAVKAATDAGLFMAVAAGNNAEPAAQWSPASAPTACTVGATDIFDEFA